MRVVDTAIQQFEALKPVVVKLREVNSELRQTNIALRVGVLSCDSSRARTERALVYQTRLTTNAEVNWQKYQTKSTARGWTIAGLVGLLIGGVLLQLH